MTEQKTKTINKSALKGVVSDVRTKSGETNGRAWSLHNVTLVDVEGAGKGAKDKGVLSFSSFGSAPKVGDLIGVYVRINGVAKEINIQGEQAEVINHYLSAIGDFQVVKAGVGVPDQYKKTSQPSTSERVEHTKPSDADDGDLPW